MLRKLHDKKWYLKKKPSKIIQKIRNAKTPKKKNIKFPLYPLPFVPAIPAFLVLAPVGSSPLSRMTTFFSGCFSRTFAATDKPTNILILITSYQRMSGGSRIIIAMSES